MSLNWMAVVCVSLRNASGDPVLVPAHVPGQGAEAALDPVPAPGAGLALVPAAGAVLNRVPAPSPDPAAAPNLGIVTEKLKLTENAIVLRVDPDPVLDPNLKLDPDPDLN